MAKATKKPGRSATPRRTTWLQHAAPASIFVLYMILWKAAPEAIPHLAQEDSWIEWLTVIAFGSASVAFTLVGAERGWRDGFFAWGLALFCLIVAGEEISWGQRLFSFVPPEVFLEKNYQEEANFHNFFNREMGPKWMLVVVLAGWGLLLPLLRKGGASGLLERLRVIEPPIVLAPWFVFALILLEEYPFEMTAEYVELIAGVLFLVTAIPLPQPGRKTYVALAGPLVAVGAASMYLNLQELLGSQEKHACAVAETRALAAAVDGGASLPRLVLRRSIDYRVHTTIQMGFLKPEIVASLDAVACEGVSTNPNRRRYGLDPWGQPYWMYYERGAGRESGTALFYSFGPNRRYDSPKGRIDGTDDVGARSQPLKLDARVPK